MNCDWDIAKYLIFSSNVDAPLIYYSHITSIIIFFGILLLTLVKTKVEWPKNSFRILGFSYIVWLFCDLVLWANDKPDNIVFFWTLINLVEPLIFTSAYTHYISFTEKRFTTLKEKVLIFLLLIPTIVMAPIGLSVVGFDSTSCDRNVIEGVAAYYNYFLEAAFLILILYHSLISFKKISEKEQRLRLVLSTTSLISLLVSFLAANFLGTLFEEYSISQLGHIAVPIFAALLIYTTVRYDSFKARILLIDSLSATLIIAIASLFFVRDQVYFFYATSVTLLLSIPLLILLLRGIRKETNSREQIEKLAKDLEKANVRLKVLDKEKTEFVSLASHQLRAPMTAIKGYISMIFEGDYGPVPKDLTDPVKRIFTSTQSLVQIVGDFLDVSRIELGTMKFNFTDFDLKALVKQITEELQPNIEISKLEFKFDADEGAFPLHGDSTKLKQVFNNLIDNALKYTKSGCVHVSLTKTADKYTFKVIDSGVGINKEMIPKLFDKFVRASNANEANVIGTGLGLYVARQMVDKHHGKIWAESEGEGKGSTFVVEIPAT